MERGQRRRREEGEDEKAQEEGVTASTQYKENR